MHIRTFMPGQSPRSGVRYYDDDGSKSIPGPPRALLWWHGL